MNPWTAILDPRSLIPKDQERGRRHILSAETLEPASKPAPKATPAPTPIPRKPEPTAYIEPKPEAMPYPVALLIRERASMRQPVPAYLLAEANQVVEEKRLQEGHKV